MRKAVAVGAVLLGLGLAGCNNETPASKVGSGAGETGNAGATSGRVTTQGEAQKSGGG